MGTKHLLIADSGGALQLMIIGAPESLEYAVARVITDGGRYSMTDNMDVINDPGAYELGAGNGSGGPSDTNPV
jgi:hypothetical protein